jgi:nicotinamidase-related amidase
MSVTVLDPKTALVIIDLQNGIVSFPAAGSIDDVVKHAAALADVFRRQKRPVVLVNVDGSAPGRTELQRRITEFPAGWTDFIPALGQRPEDYVVTKRTWGAFTNTDLETYLKELGVTQVVLAGVATSIGVEATARQAYELGFHVTLAVDAMMDLSSEAHENSVTRIFPKLGETGSTDDIITLLGGSGM